MPRLPGWAWMLLAIVFATMATFMAFRFINRQTAKAPVKEKIYVVRAKDKVEQEKVLSAAQLVRSVWDQEKPPQDFFSEVKDVAGRQTAKPLQPGEVITRENTRTLIPGLAGKVSSDERAITVKVDEVSGVSGFLNPEDRVDVVVVMDKGDYNKNPVARTILQNLKILGTGQKTVTSLEDKPQIVPTVTLEVTPEQGELLALAAVEGRISLVLRGQLPEGAMGADASKPKPAVPGSPVLGPNQRAVTVKVDEASGVPGSLTPGNRVDVMLVMDKGEWAKYPIAKILFQDLTVLGTDKKQRVTLAATPQQAVDLTWAAQAGRLSLVLRESDDNTADKNKEKEKAKTVEANAGLVFGKPDSISGSLQIIRGIEMREQVPLDNKNRPASAVTR